MARRSQGVDEGYCIIGFIFDVCTLRSRVYEHTGQVRPCRVGVEVMFVAEVSWSRWPCELITGLGRTVSVVVVLVSTQSMTKPDFARVSAWKVRSICRTYVERLDTPSLAHSKWASTGSGGVVSDQPGQTASADTDTACHPHEHNNQAYDSIARAYVIDSIPSKQFETTWNHRHGKLKLTV